MSTAVTTSRGDGREGVLHHAAAAGLDMTGERKTVSFDRNYTEAIGYYIGNLEMVRYNLRDALEVIGEASSSCSRRPL